MVLENRKVVKVFYLGYFNCNFNKKSVKEESGGQTRMLDHIIKDLKKGNRSVDLNYTAKLLEELRDRRIKDAILEKELALISAFKADSWCIGCEYIFNEKYDGCGDCFEGSHKVPREKESIDLEYGELSDSVAELKQEIIALRADRRFWQEQFAEQNADYYKLLKDKDTENKLLKKNL